MSTFNALLRGGFDALLSPFSGIHPLWGLTALSLATAIGMLLVFKWTSDQGGLEAVKRKIHACLFEIRLFNDDFRAILRAQGEIMRHNLTYLRLSLVPMIWIIPPLFFLVAQVHFHYGYEGLEPGDRTTVTVHLSNARFGSTAPDVSLEAPPGLEVETAAVWVPVESEMVWRIRATEAGIHDLTVRAEGQTLTKRIVVSDEIVRTPPERLAGTFLNQLIYPAEAPIPPDAPVDEIRVDFSGREIPVFGWHTHWLVVFFVLSIVFAFALRNRLGVQI